MNKYSLEEIEEALIDLLNGVDEYEIQESTGLSIERCKEIKELYYKVLSYHKFN